MRYHGNGVFILVPVAPIIMSSNGAPTPPPTSSSAIDNTTRMRPTFFFETKGVGHTRILTNTRMLRETIVVRIPVTKKLGTTIIASHPSKTRVNADPS